MRMQILAQLHAHTIGRATFHCMQFGEDGCCSTRLDLEFMYNEMIIHNCLFTHYFVQFVPLYIFEFPLCLQKVMTTEIKGQKVPNSF